MTSATRARLAAARRNRELWRRVLLPFELSEELIEDIHIAARRAGSQPDAALDAALGRMLDHLERVPWCRRCLQTIGDCECRVAMTGARR